ncbi:hypothetical protein [Colwellia sp. Bg11-12]|uniref:hypothetical protein n=1 Tax=Colwellia sp. Bg11-12 TaxID=2759817 RepID=UPI0015F68212|nr:hypothetical protein [Colwellia sp. Bg11-12]MBA6262191.1 hypothetical protein [Colwellia sp. Bg11-12]
MKFLIVLFISILSGCSVVVHDKTNDPIAASFVGNYYKTAKDGFLYKARCADINGNVQSTEWCTGLQAFNSGNEYATTPANYQTYKSSQKEWDEKLFTKLAFEKQRSIISQLPQGTVLKITKLVQYPWGTNGYYWAIRAAMITPEGNQLEIELPTNRVLAFPTWLKGYGVQKLPKFKLEFLKICTDAKCT